MKVKYEGVEHEVGEPDSLDMVRLERQFSTSATVLGEPEKTRIEYLLFMLHSRLRRAGVTTAKYSDDEIVKMELVGEDEDAAVDPTEGPETQPAS